MLIKSLLKKTLLTLIVLVVLALISSYILLRASLPKLQGALQISGLQQPVRIERDILGVATIRAENPIDAARALGFVHAQERFFEMDLLRRSASGELSELFGPMAIEKDKTIRIHRLRARIQQNFKSLVGHDQALLLAYTDGVNAGLKALSAKPWAYVLLGTKPKPWLPEDSFLVGYAMFFDLQDESNTRELKLWQLKQQLPPPIYNLLTQSHSGWDAPMFGQADTKVIIPTAADINLNHYSAPQLAYNPNKLSQAVGSNNFAVSGALTSDGRAIVADDMHLGIRAPNIWFRARLLTGKNSDVSGFTLPGIPSMVVGSNTHIAWGFTNSYGDWSDFFQVHWANASKSAYFDAHNIPQAVQTFHEVIKVKGGKDASLTVRETQWGPITQDIDAEHALALSWAAHKPGSLNLGLNQLAQSQNLDEALQAAKGIGMPAQNLVMADSHGRIAWRLTAQIPKRIGNCDKTAPLNPQAGCAWDGWLDGALNPKLVDPANHRLWTANARIVEGDWLDLVGDSGYALGARAQQIRNDLLSKDQFSERDLLAIQTDDRAIFLTRWWHLLEQKAQSAPKHSALKQLFQAGNIWEGHASTRSVSYRIVRAWHLEVSKRIEAMLLSPATEQLAEKSNKPGDNGVNYEAPSFTSFEDVAWALIAEQPKHLLTRDYHSWDELLEQSAQTVRDKLLQDGALAERTWGERNTASICHPLAAALPKFAKPLLCMPSEALNGDSDMPLVVGPNFGASERMVVSPGREAQGIIHMPGGQSGHLLSPFWGAGHEAWVNHQPTPFLPGKTLYTLSLSPAK